MILAQDNKNYMSIWVYGEISGEWVDILTKFYKGKKEKAHIISIMSSSLLVENSLMNFVYNLEHDRFYLVDFNAREVVGYIDQESLPNLHVYVKYEERYSLRTKALRFVYRSEIINKTVEEGIDL
jgi:hypothetical protein